MVGQADPIKLITTAPAEPFVQDGKALVDLNVRTITLNSITFWRSDEGMLFLRGYDEDQQQLVDLPASNVRFVV